MTGNDFSNAEITSALEAEIHQVAREEGLIKRLSEAAESGGSNSRTVLRMVVTVPGEATSSVRSQIGGLERKYEKELRKAGWSVEIQSSRLVSGTHWRFEIDSITTRDRAIPRLLKDLFLCLTLPDNSVVNRRTRNGDLVGIDRGTFGVPNAIVPDSPIALIQVDALGDSPHLNVETVSADWRLVEEMVQGDCRTGLRFSSKAVDDLGKPIGEYTLFLSSKPVPPDQVKVKEFRVQDEDREIRTVYAITQNNIITQNAAESTEEGEYTEEEKYFMKRYACATQEDRDALAGFFRKQSIQVESLLRQGEYWEKAALLGNVQVINDPSEEGNSTDRIERSASNDAQKSLWPFEVTVTMSARTPVTFNPPSRLALKRLRVMATLLDGLHAKDMAHGDVKPNNIVENGDGVCALVDWETLSGGELPITVLGTEAFTPPDESQPPDISDLNIRDRFGFLGVCYCALNTVERLADWRRKVFDPEWSEEAKRFARLRAELEQENAKEAKGWCERVIDELLYDPGGHDPNSWKEIWKRYKKPYSCFLVKKLRALLRHAKTEQYLDDRVRLVERGIISHIQFWQRLCFAGVVAVGIMLLLLFALRLMGVIS